ncbi:putative ribonuclease H-like domain-containing protein, partial [Tanacetum coccineum]
HFARECRFAKYQENRANGRQEKRIVAIEDPNSKALVATDNNEDIDWTKEFNAEPVTFAVKALTELKVDDCSMEFDSEHVHFGQDRLGDFDWSNIADDTPVSLALMATNSEDLELNTVVVRKITIHLVDPLYENFKREKAYKAVPPPTGLKLSKAQRLGHETSKNINKLVKGNLVRGLPSKTFKLDHSCLACRKGKQHRASCKKIEERIIREPLELLHMDLFRPVSVESVNKKKYCLVVTDDCSKFSWVFFLAYKDETYDMLHDLIMFSDYTYTLDQWVSLMQSEEAIVDTLQQQSFRVYKAQNTHSEERTADKEVPLSSEDQALHDELVSLMHQESIAKVHNDAQRNAFEEEKRRIALEKGKESANSTLTLSTANTPSQSTGNTPTDSDDDVPKDGVFSTNSFDDENTDNEEGGAPDYNNMDPTIDVSSTPTLRIHKIHPQSQIIGKSTAGVLTRRKLKEGASVQHQALLSFMYKQNRTNHKDQQTCLFACFLSQEEPKKVSQALADESWVEAMQEELLQFKLQDVWVLCDLPDGKRVIGTKWVFRNKRDERGTIIKNKARLVAQGYRQEEGCAIINEVFAPVAKLKQSDPLFGILHLSWALLSIRWMSKVHFLYWKQHRRDVCKIAPPRRGAIDKTLFIKKDRRDIMLVQVYVDDIIFGSTKSSMVKDFEELMQKEFKMSSMGELTFFLGPQVSTLLWFVQTLKEAFSDSDYAGDNHDRRSTLGGCQYLGKRLVSWQCKKQTIVAISSTEAEYVVAASCCARVLWMQNQLLDYGFKLHSTLNSKSTMRLHTTFVKNPVHLHQRQSYSDSASLYPDCYKQRLINVSRVGLTNIELETFLEEVRRAQEANIFSSQTIHQFKGQTQETVKRDFDATDAVVTPDLERKSDEIEEVLIEEEKDASDVKSKGILGVEDPKEEIISSTNQKLWRLQMIGKCAKKVQAERMQRREEKVEDLKKPKPKTISKKPTSLAQERNQMMSFLKGRETKIYKAKHIPPDYYEHIPPTGLGLMLLGDLNIIWETAESSDDDFWKDQEEWEIIRWRFHESSGVHTLEIEDGTMIHMLAERRYPLSRELMIRMLEHGMEVEDESETAITLIHLFILWTTEDGDNS